MPIGSEDLAAIRKQSEQFFAALGRGDVGAVTEMHTDNAVVLPPNRRIIQGADIDAFWRERSGEPDGIFGFKVPFSSLEGGDKRSHMKLTFFNLGKRLAEARINESA